MQFIPCKLGSNSIEDIYDLSPVNDGLCNYTYEEGEINGDSWSQAIYDCTSGYYLQNPLISKSISCSDWGLRCSHKIGWVWYNDAVCEISCAYNSVFTDNVLSGSLELTGYTHWPKQILYCIYPNLTIEHVKFAYYSSPGTISVNFELPFRFYKKITYRVMHEPHCKYYYHYIL